VNISIPSILTDSGAIMVVLCSRQNP